MSPVISSWWCSQTAGLLKLVTSAKLTKAARAGHAALAAEATAHSAFAFPALTLTEL